MLLVTLLLWMATFRLPGLLRAPKEYYYPWCELAVIVAAAWVLYVWFATDWDKHHFGRAAGDVGLRIARVFFGLAMIPFGLGHFQFIHQTAEMVPRWLPWHLTWAYFFGCTFIAAGLGVLIGVAARLAAVLMTLQIGLFTVLVWYPVVASARPKTAFELERNRPLHRADGRRLGCSRFLPGSAVARTKQTLVDCKEQAAPPVVPNRRVSSY